MEISVCQGISFAVFEIEGSTPSSNVHCHGLISLQSPSRRPSKETLLSTGDPKHEHCPNCLWLRSKKKIPRSCPCIPNTTSPTSVANISNEAMALKGSPAMNAHPAFSLLYKALTEPWAICRTRSISHHSTPIQISSPSARASARNNSTGCGDLEPMA